MQNGVCWHHTLDWGPPKRVLYTLQSSCSPAPMTQRGCISPTEKKKKKQGPKYCKNHSGMQPTFKIMCYV